MGNSMEDSRKKFEYWFTEVEGRPKEKLERDEDGSYLNFFINSEFLSFHSGYSFCLLEMSAKEEERECEIPKNLIPFRAPIDIPNWRK